MEMIAAYIAAIADIRAKLSGSFLAAILHILESDASRVDDAGNRVRWTEQDAINVWQDALAQTHVSKATLDAADKLIAQIASVKDGGLFTGEEWSEVWDEHGTLISELSEAREKLKNAHLPRITGDNERSEEVWRKAVSWAAHWQIVPQTKKPFNRVTKKKNEALIKAAIACKFATDDSAETKLAMLDSIAGESLFRIPGSYPVASA